MVFFDGCTWTHVPDCRAEVGVDVTETGRKSLSQEIKAGLLYR